MPPLDDDRLLDLLAEWEECRQQGRIVTAEALCPDDAVLLQALRAAIAEHLRIERMLSLPERADRHAQSTSVDVPVERRESEQAPVPSRIGRYRVERLLGRGGFGLVYLAFDEQLGRPVAIKVLHPELVTDADQAASFRTEARSVASLDHPHIVPVYDVGSTAEFPCFVVSKYVEGVSLSSRLKQSKFSPCQAAELIATVADAVHYAHKRGFVHRDVKPPNILLADNGEPFVIDFGLALQLHQQGTGRRFAGTPAYMSPEQARGESHRVDGRSDIFSLGAVLYEMLVGHRAFAADSNSDLLSEIASAEPRPPRQIDDRIPPELERICLKALAKRASERYTTAKDLADDLRDHLHCHADSLSGRTPRTADALAPQTSRATEASAEITPSGTSPSAPIVPKGLRSFDEHDASFFLELLPGPFDREGLPDSIRFWKTRIEETEADQTFSVGLLYGPSGSGKTSLIRAGLIPRLSERVVCIHLDATADETERRLLAVVRRKFPDVSPDLPLKETLASIRRQTSSGARGKLLIVLDQFEQWLHTRQDYHDSELVQALRECDGGRLQCLVMVRDDFWMAATRFLRELEIPLVEGRNSNAVDLFPERHARRVLLAFGRAFGALPTSSNELSREQHDFLDEAVRHLSNAGRVVSVRLALFADLMRGRPWIPATLKQVGGSDGVGVVFLEETFAGRHAPPLHRLHQQAARAVLAKLLPELGTDIRGHRRSYAELLEASGYSGRPARLDELLHVLDGELRLITPADDEAATDDPLTDHAAIDGDTTRRHGFQLTHDYLVPSLRDWLTRKQKETWRGRAELQLAERTALWTAKPERRTLPTLAEFASISFWTKRRSRTEPQCRMMRRAATFHLTRWGSLLAAVCAAGIAAQRFISSDVQTRVRTALDRVQFNVAVEVPKALRELSTLPRESVRREIESRHSTGDAKLRLRLAYAQAELGRPDPVFLCSQVGIATADEANNLIAALNHSREPAVIALTEAAARCDAESNWWKKSWLATIALHLGDRRLATDMCRIDNRPDPTQRSVFIEALSGWQANIAGLPGSVGAIHDPALQSGLCIGIGSMPVERVSPAEREAWQPLFTEWMQTSPASVTHSAAALPLFYWGLPVPEFEPSRGPVDGRHWHVNSLKMTMIEVPAGRVTLSGRGGSETVRTPEDVASFWLGDREVTVWQFLAFLSDDHCAPEDKPIKPPPFKVPLSPFHPAHSVSWHDAALFCNWLSRREGFVPCYERSEKIDEFNSVLWRLRPEGTGYRLPSEAQWEHACRAGTESQFSNGSGLFLGRYANILSQELVPCGILAPNGWGVFDMHGNVKEWCQDDRWPGENLYKVIRGGSYRVYPGDAASSFRGWGRPSDNDTDHGFRVALPATDRPAVRQ